MSGSTLLLFHVVVIGLSILTPISMAAAIRWVAPTRLVRPDVFGDTGVSRFFDGESILELPGRTQPRKQMHRVQIYTSTETRLPASES
ncbi:MAG: hypothetical protein AAFU85_02770 [Planctomycetota bacterium]